MKIIPLSLYASLRLYLEMREITLSALLAMRKYFNMAETMPLRRCRVLRWLNICEGARSTMRRRHADYLAAVKRSWARCTGLLDMPGRRPLVRSAKEPLSTQRQLAA